MNINLEPITDETNIEGNVAYIKVELMGYIDGLGDVGVRSNWTSSGADIESNLYIRKSNIFIPTKVKNRRYKKGDDVRLSRFIRGINVHKMNLTRDKVYTLQSRENKSGNFWLYDDTGQFSSFPHVFFELVKSIEEIEAEKPYQVVQNDIGVCVLNEGVLVNSFCYNNYGEEKAKELAQLCCDFLNDKHTEEQKKKLQ